MSETIITLSSKKYQSEGDLSWEYNPLHNIITDKGENNDPHALSDFDTAELNLDVEHPVEVEVQPSYDGSVNLIINDDHDVPRIVNSAFTVQEGWKYKRVIRDQQKQTNYHHEGDIEKTTRLFRTTSEFLHVDLTDVESGGELKGGNYKFYFKYGDDDYNETDWIGESGIVSIFRGFPSQIKNIRGTLMDEKTDHQITLYVSGADTAFSKLYVYAKRSFADLNGVLKDEYYKLVEPYNITGNSFNITITGFEKTCSVSQEQLNTSYNVYDAVATSTQVQNRLFFGNVKEIVPKHTLLCNCALNIKVGLTDTNIGIVSTNYTATSIRGSEYYNPLNIYNNLGYWGGELYRLGVVFIYNNDTLSDVYNLKGCCFDSIHSTNNSESQNSFKEYDVSEIFINGDSRFNTRGVFQIPDINICGVSEVKPIGFKMSIPDYVVEKLEELKIKGLFFVRQPRIPIALCQAISIGISDRANIPVLSRMENGKCVYITEGIIEGERLGRHVLKSTCNDKEEWTATCCALICQDANFNKSLQSLFDGAQFILKPVGQYSLEEYDRNQRLFNVSTTYHDDNIDTVSAKLAYVSPGVPSRVLEGRVFSSKAGSSSDVRTIKNLRWDANNMLSDGTRKVDDWTVRGNYTGYVGVVSGKIKENTLYTIYTPSYIGTNITTRKLQIESRAQDSTPFTSISQRVSLKAIKDTDYTVFGGDCFTCTTSVKMCSNFLDHNTPLNDKIVKYNIGNDEKNWNDYDSWNDSDKNVSDWNAVSIGHYVTYKCLSNYNLGIRCIDDQNIDERALFGDIRSFYPYAQHTYGVSFKIPESTLMNHGNSATSGALYYFYRNSIPFTKEFFDNRIAFSNIQSVDSFQNNYRVFSNMSYTDIERKYGAITKLLPLGSNLFCVFEHGCGIIPINEKALMSTTTGQSIHLYGSDVVQSQVTVVSPDYGSTWEESIVVTPNGIYGVDTFAKKIWCFSGNNFTIISDMLVQRFLNDNINLTDYEQNAMVASRNVKTHYNNYKGDVMFTFYNGNKEWNLCYNERIQKWVTKYSWIPVYSANIYNSFVSTDKKRSEYYSKIDALNHVEKGLNWSENKNPSISYNSTKKRYECDDIGLTIKGFEDFEREDTSSIDKTCFTWTPIIKSVDFYIGDKVQQFYTGGKAVQIYDSCDEIKKCSWHSINVSKGKIVHWECPNYGIIGRASDNISFEGGLYDVTHVWDKCDEWFDTYVKYPINLRNGAFVVNTDNSYSADNPLYQVYIDFDYNIHMSKEYYIKEDDVVESTQEIIKSIRPDPNKPWEVIGCSSGTVSLPIIVDWKSIPEENPDGTESEQNINLRNAIDDKLRIQFYTHGRAGYHEAKVEEYLLKPTNWYGKQEPFEFEFVVNANMGIQKIFNNLVIISNNAEPDSIECTIVGDSYGFDKENILKGNEGELNFNVEFKINPDENIAFTTNVIKDKVLNQNTLTTCSKLRDFNEYGRRVGNMQYLEDKWNITLDPIYYKKVDADNSQNSKTNSVRLRDKWMKVRIKYKGDKLAVISAIQSLYTISFA